MKLNLSRYAPPGFELASEKMTFFCGLAIAFFFSNTYFLRLGAAEDSLYNYTGKGRYLIPGAVMPDFVELLGNALLGFPILAICMAAFIIIHYAYHHQHSKSIYLMRRLPNPMERHRRCITLPILAVIICILAGFVLLLIYYGIYLMTTPDGCLTPNQWQKIWRVFL